MEDRRRHMRYPFERHLQVRADPPLGKLLVEAVDISESGFSFVAPTKMEVGDLIVLGLRNEDYFLIEATVRNVRQDGDRFVIGAERTGAT